MAGALSVITLLYCCQTEPHGHADAPKMASRERTWEILLALWDCRRLHPSTYIYNVVNLSLSILKCKTYCTVPRGYPYYWKRKLYVRAYISSAAILTCTHPMKVKWDIPQVMPRSLHLASQTCQRTSLLEIPSEQKKQCRIPPIIGPRGNCTERMNTVRLLLHACYCPSLCMQDNESLSRSLSLSASGAPSVVLAIWTSKTTEGAPTAAVVLVSIPKERHFCITAEAHPFPGKLLCSP